MKKNLIQKQKEKIQEIRENSGSELAREEAMNKLNLMQDDLEKNGEIIYSDKIPLYYDLMGEKELNYYKYAIDGSMSLNGLLIYQKLFLDTDVLNYNNTFSEIYNQKAKDEFLKHVKCTTIETTKKFIVAQSYFGIKDTMKPHKEYIEEIRNSAEYKNYISLIEAEKVAALEKLTNLDKYGLSLYSKYTELIDKGIECEIYVGSEAGHYFINKESFLEEYNKDDTSLCYLLADDKGQCIFSKEDFEKQNQDENPLNQSVGSSIINDTSLDEAKQLVKELNTHTVTLKQK